MAELAGAMRDLVMRHLSLPLCHNGEGQVQTHTSIPPPLPPSAPSIKTSGRFQRTLTEGRVSSRRGPLKGWEDEHQLSLELCFMCHLPLDSNPPRPSRHLCEQQLLHAALYMLIFLWGWGHVYACAHAWRLEEDVE